MSTRSQQACVLVPHVICAIALNSAEHAVTRLVLHWPICCVCSQAGHTCYNGADVVWPTCCNSLSACQHATPCTAFSWFAASLLAGANVAAHACSRADAVCAATDHRAGMPNGYVSHYLHSSPSHLLYCNLQSCKSIDSWGRCWQGPHACVSCHGCKQQ